MAPSSFLRTMAFHCACIAVLLASCSTMVAQSRLLRAGIYGASTPSQPIRSVSPLRNAIHSRRRVQAESIEYHGGPIMAPNPINLYIVYYGQWGPGTGMEIVRNFIQSMSDTSVSAPNVASWWAITTAYHDGNGNYVSSQVRFSSS